MRKTELCDMVALIATKGVTSLDSTTSLIRNEIRKQHGSTKNFSEKSDIPYSTLSNALSKGVGGTSYDTVVKICKMLTLKQVFSESISLFSKPFYSINAMLSSLDEQGLHTVETVLSVEYARCKNNASPTVRTYNGIGFALEMSDNASCGCAKEGCDDGER